MPNLKYLRLAHALDLAVFNISIVRNCLEKSRRSHVRERTKKQNVQSSELKQTRYYLVVRPGTPSSVLAPSSTARSPY